MVIFHSYVELPEGKHPRVVHDIHHWASSSSSLGAWGVGAASTPGMLAKSGHTLRAGQALEPAENAVVHVELR